MPRDIHDTVSLPSRRRGRSEWRRKAGLTMAEMMIAVMVVGLGLASVGGLIFWMQQAMDVTRDNAIALTLLENNMEQLMAGTLSGSGSNSPLSGFQCTWQTAALSGYSSETQVVATVSWSDMRNRARSLTATSITARISW